MMKLTEQFRTLKCKINVIPDTISPFVHYPMLLGIVIFFLPTPVYTSNLIPLLADVYWLVAMVVYSILDVNPFTSLVEF